MCIRDRNLPSGTYSGVTRGAGFTEAVAKADLASVNVELVQGQLAGYAGGAAIAAQLLDRPANLRPDGIFCANDLLAFGFLDTARYDFGLRVPDDLVLVGFDDLPMASAAAFGLTTLRQNVSDLASEVVDLSLIHI